MGPVGIRVAVGAVEERFGAVDSAPQMRQAADDEEDGRGLFLVGVISEQWGVLPAVSGSGRTVWASFLTSAPAGAETSG